jgi:hypothetical protein
MSKSVMFPTIVVIGNELSWDFANSRQSGVYMPVTSTNFKEMWTSLRLTTLCRVFFPHQLEGKAAHLTATATAGLIFGKKSDMQEPDITNCSPDDLIVYFGQFDRYSDIFWYTQKAIPCKIIMNENWEEYAIDSQNDYPTRLCPIVEGQEQRTSR